MPLVINENYAVDRSHTTHQDRAGGDGNCHRGGIIGGIEFAHEGLGTTRAQPDGGMGGGNARA